MASLMATAMLASESKCSVGPEVVTPAPESCYSAPGAAPSFYHPELDGLRFFAFLAVFCFHVFPLELPEVVISNRIAAEVVAWFVALFKAGQLGVDLFFVLSSYLITELLVREWQAKGTIDVGAFYMRRALRIWPLYYTFLLFVFFCEPFYSHGSLHINFAVSMALFSGNWANVALLARPTSVAALLWSVSVEEQFYLAWPWLMRWLTPARLAWACVAMIGIAFVMRAFLVANGAHHYLFYYNTFVRLDSLAAGALVALWLNGKAPSLSTEQRALIAILALATMVAGVRLMLVSEGPIWMELLTYPLWTLASAAILLATLQPEGEATGFLTWTPVVYLGRISYGLYVVHFFVIVLVVSLGFCHAGTPLHGLYSLLGTIALAALSYQFLEKPFLRWKDHFAVVASGKCERPARSAEIPATGTPELAL